MTIITKLLTVLYNSAFEMMNICKALVLHIGTEVFATNITGAVRQNWFIFRKIIELRFDIFKCFNFRFNDILGLKRSYVTFVIVTSIQYDCIGMFFKI